MLTLHSLLSSHLTWLPLLRLFLSANKMRHLSAVNQSDCSNSWYVAPVSTVSHGVTPPCHVTPRPCVTHHMSRGPGCGEMWQWPHWSPSDDSDLWLAESILSPDSGLRMVTFGTIITTSWHISLTPEVSSQDVSYKLKTLTLSCLCPFLGLQFTVDSHEPCKPLSLQSRSSRLLLLGGDIREANVSVWRSGQINHPDPDPRVMSKDSFRQLPVSLLQCLCIVNIFSMFCCECFDIRGDKTCWISHSQSMENEGGEMS